MNRREREGAVRIHGDVVGREDWRGFGAGVAICDNLGATYFLQAWRVWWNTGVSNKSTFGSHGQRDSMWACRPGVEECGPQCNAMTFEEKNCLEDFGGLVRVSCDLTIIHVPSVWLLISFVLLLQVFWWVGENFMFNAHGGTSCSLARLVG